MISRAASSSVRYCEVGDKVGLRVRCGGDDGDGWSNRGTCDAEDVSS